MLLKNFLGYKNNYKICLKRVGRFRIAIYKIIIVDRYNKFKECVGLYSNNSKVYSSFSKNLNFKNLKKIDLF
jgi:hypothetical protein